MVKGEKDEYHNGFGFFQSKIYISQKVELTLNFPWVDLDRDYVGLTGLDVSDGQVKDSTVFARLLSKPPKADQ